MSRPSAASRCFYLLAAIVLAAACRLGVPVVDPSPKPPTLDGTVSGRVLSAAGAPVSARRIDSSRREVAEGAEDAETD